MHLKIYRSAGTGAYMQKGTASRLMVASRSKVSFDQMVTPVLEIMDASLY
jgi:hypothetical protein